MIALEPGDQYVIEWHDRDIQRYRVDEIRGDNIVSRRWIEHKEKWTDWPVVQKASRLPWNNVRKCDDVDSARQRGEGE